MERGRGERYTLVAVLVVLVAALALRLTGLWELGLGFDELQHIYAAHGLNENGEAVLPSGMNYRRSFAFTYMVATSIALFGDTAGAARLPSVLFSTATIGIVYLLGRRLFGATAALLAAILLAAIPFELTWARTARMYAVYQFFYVFSAYAFYRGFEPGEERPGPLSRVLSRATSGSAWLGSVLRSLNVEWLLVALLSFGMAFHLHSLAGSLGLSLLAYAALLAGVTGLASGVRAGLLGKYGMLAIGLTLAAGVGFGLPQVRWRIVDALTFGPEWTQHVPIQITYYLFWLNSQFMFPLFAFFLLGCLQAFTRLDRGACFAVVCGLVPLALHSTVVRVQHPRYVYDFFPFVVLVASYAACNLYASERERIQNALARVSQSRWEGLASAVLLGALVIAFLGIPPGLRIGTRISLHQGSGFGGPVNVRWSDACRFLTSSAAPGDRIVASIPLAAAYSGCPHVDFNLDNGEIDQFFPAKAGGLPRHSFADTPALVDLKSLQQVLEPGVTFWLALDRERFESNGNTPPDVREFVVQRFERRWQADDGSVTVFSWTVPATGADPSVVPGSAS